MWRALLIVLILAVACTPPSGGDAGPDPVDDAGSGDCLTPSAGERDGTCALDERVGGFVVDNQAQFTVVSGDVKDAILPQSVLIERQREGGCALLERPLLFCDPPCGAGETCAENNACVAFPTGVDMGSIQIGGLDTCVDMEPLPPGFNYFFNGLGRPGMEPGADIELRGDELELFAQGVAEMAPSEPLWVLTETEDFVIEWAAGDTAAEVTISVSIDQHGTSPLRLECVFDDTGAGTVPASVVDALINAGVSGFPSGKISRRTADKQDVPGGCVDLVVSSTRVQDVRVTGFTPCNRDEDCPGAQTCDVPNEICVGDP